MVDHVVCSSQYLGNNNQNRNFVISYWENNLGVEETWKSGCFWKWAGPNETNRVDHESRDGLVSNAIFLQTFTSNFGKYKEIGRVFIGQCN